MKVLELQKMETISAGGFWGGFCGATSIIGGAASLAVYFELIAISGGTAVVGLAIIGIGCGIAAFQ